MSDPTRRDFAAAAVAVALTATRAPAADEPKPDAAKALADVVRGRFGPSLSAEQIAALQRSVTNMLLSVERLKKVPLTNADEPAVIFRADVP